MAFMVAKPQEQEWLNQRIAGMRKLLIGVALMALFSAGEAQATDDCPSSYICASNPAGIQATMQTLGYKAVLGKATTSGNPKISSAASGYNYDIFFYGCEKNVNCNSLSFSTTFEKEEVNSAALANEWNVEKRFSAVSFDPKDGTLTISYDVTTVGGLDQVNFAEVVSWWDTMMGEASTFFKNHPSPKKK